MSVRVTRYRRGGWEIDIRVRLPSGRPHREKRKAPVTSKTAARRWGEERERHLALYGPNINRKEIPTLAEFKDRFIENHCKANRHKPSGIAGKESQFRNHLLPLFANKKLDAISNEDVARLKRRLQNRKPATVNNALTCLSQTLRCAVDWGVIEKMPCRIRLLKVQNRVSDFYDFDEYQWLLEAARKIGRRQHLLVLLAGDAGLRRGEAIALERTDCDLRRRKITVQRSEWKGHVTETKGMDTRVVPMTNRLHAALVANEHLVGDRVLYAETMEQVTAKVIQRWMAKIQRRARLRAKGGYHLLRHTFCSHLAMKGAPAIAIQRLAGHKNLQTTLKYMHLAPGETDRAIGLLESHERNPNEETERQPSLRIVRGGEHE